MCIAVDNWVVDASRNSHGDVLARRCSPLIAGTVDWCSEGEPNSDVLRSLTVPWTMKFQFGNGITDGMAVLRFRSRLRRRASKNGINVIPWSSSSAHEDKHVRSVVFARLIILNNYPPDTWYKYESNKNNLMKNDSVSIKENKYGRLLTATSDRIGQGICSANIIWKLNETEVN